MHRVEVSFRCFGPLGAFPEFEPFCFWSKGFLCCRKKGLTDLKWSKRVFSLIRFVSFLGKVTASLPFYRMVSRAMLPLALVMAALLSSATALPLVRGGEGSLDQGNAVPVHGAMLATTGHEDQWEVGAASGVERKSPLHLFDEFRSGGAPQELVVSELEVSVFRRTRRRVGAYAHQLI